MSVSLPVGLAEFGPWGMLDQGAGGPNWHHLAVSFALSSGGWLCCSCGRWQGKALDPASGPEAAMLACKPRFTHTASLQQKE